MEKSKLTKTERGKTGKEQSQEHARLLLDFKRIIRNHLLWQAKQSILLTTVRFSVNCVKMWELFALFFGDKRTGCCITTIQHLTLPSSLGNFLLKTT
jgi:hypothetical protein